MTAYPFVVMPVLSFLVLGGTTAFVFGASTESDVPYPAGILGGVIAAVSALALLREMGVVG